MEFNIFLMELKSPKQGPQLIRMRPALKVRILDMQMADLCILEAGVGLKDYSLVIKKGDQMALNMKFPVTRPLIGPQLFTHLMQVPPRLHQQTPHQPPEIAN